MDLVKGVKIWALNWAVAQHVQQYCIYAKRRIKSASAFARSGQSQDILWVAKGLKCLQMDIKDSDQPALMRMLIWVFPECTGNLVGNAVARLYSCNLYNIKISRIYMSKS